MSKGEVIEDVAFLLYLVPLLASAGYALLLWIPRGLSASLPEDIYLIVTKDPRVFLLGFSAVSVAVLIELYSSQTGSTREKLAVSSGRIQRLSIACLLLAAVSAWSATGYSNDLGHTTTTFLSGRYSILFPLLTLLTSFLFSAPAYGKLSGRRLVDVVSVGAVIASPVLLYLTWRIGLPWTLSFGIALLLLGSGLAMLVYGSVKTKSS